MSNAVSDISKTIKREANGKNISIEVSVFKTMFSVKFAKREDFRYFYRNLLTQGIYFAPSEYEANFISFSHTKKDIETTKSAIKNIFRNWE